MPEYDWLQVKTSASEMGMSINEYFNQLARDSIKMKFLGIKVPIKKKFKAKKKRIYSALSDFAATTYKRKPMGLSEEDEIIYGI